MKICIENKDRHGLVYDISKILLKYNVNIISMEVIKNTTYLETEALSYKTEQKILSELHDLNLFLDTAEKRNFDLYRSEREPRQTLTNTMRHMFYSHNSQLKARKHVILGCEY